MKKLLKKLFIFTFQAFLLISCDSNIDTMVDSYNENFKHDSSEIDAIVIPPEPGDENFSQNEMLEEEYFVWDDASLNLSAPPNCADYSWIFTDPFADKPNEPLDILYINAPENKTQRELKKQNLAITIVTSGLETGRSYLLTLTVLSKEGYQYKDTAVIVIYQHVYMPDI